MYARAVTIQLQPDKIAEAGQIMEEVAASPRSNSGFHEATLLADTTTGHGHIITLWHSQEALQASETTVYKRGDGPTRRHLRRTAEARSPQRDHARASGGLSRPPRSIPPGNAHLGRAEVCEWRYEWISDSPTANAAGGVDAVTIRAGSGPAPTTTAALPASVR